MLIKLEYYGYVSTVRYSESDNVYYGKIENVSDLVTFEGRTQTELKAAFIEAVHDYAEEKGCSYLTLK